MKNKRLIQFFVGLTLFYACVYAEETYYQEIDVDPSATAQQVGGACRRAMLKYHPDKNTNNPEAEAKFKEINNACEVLRDAAKRKAYNESLKSGKPTSGDNRGSTLAIEAPASEQKPQTWLEKIKSKVQSTAKGKEERISSFVADQLSKIPIPNQSRTVLNQTLSLKDMSIVKLPTIPDAKMGFGIQGTMQFNQFSVKAILYVMLDKKDNKQLSLEIELPDQYSLVDMFPSIQNSVISKLKMPKGRFILATIDYTSAGWKVKKGFNFAAVLDLSGPAEILGDLTKKAASMPGVIVEGGDAIIGGLIPEDIQKLELTAAIPLKIGVDFTKIQKVPKSVSDIFKQIYTEQFSVSALPAKQKLEAGGNMKLILGTQPAPLDFVIQGSIERQLVSIAGNMNGKIELKWAALGDLAVQIDIDQATLPVTAAFGIPFTGIGLRGKLDLGKPGATRAYLNAAAKVSFKGSQIPDLIMDVDGTNLHIDDFIVFMSQVAQKQGISAQSISSDKMPTMKIDIAKGYFATADAKIGTKEYKAGLEMDIKGNLLGQKADIYLFLDPNPKNIQVKGKGFISPIDLNIIKLSGSGCKSDTEKREGACCQFDFQVAKPLEAKFFLDGKLQIPKIDIDVATQLDFEKDKFKGTFDSRVQNFFGAGFSIAIDQNKLDEFETSFNFKGDFGSFMNEMVLPEIKQLQSTAVQKAGEADAKWQDANRQWNTFNDKVNQATTELNKHRAEVDAAKGKVTQAQQILGKLSDANIKRAWDQYQSDIRACDYANRTLKRAINSRIIKD